MIHGDAVVLAGAEDINPQAAESSWASQPGNTSTAGWHLRALARVLARSTPRLILPRSIAEIVDCGMPARSASSF